MVEDDAQNEYIGQLQSEVLSLRASVADLQAKNSLLEAELLQLKVENKNLKMQSKFGYKFLEHDNSTISNFRTKFLTGLPNFAAFLWLLELCKLCLPSSQSLSSNNVLLLIMMKLNLNLKHQDLAWRFQVSCTKVSELMNKGIPAIATQLKFLIHWPSKSDLMRTMPVKFKRLYPSCRVIVDCTEIFIERSSNLTARAMFYSHYKSHPTIKLLIGITPTNGVSFVSKAWVAGCQTKS